MHRALLRAAAALIALALVDVPSARADDASEAALQHELGRQLYERRHYGEALEHFIASNRLVPNPRVVFNIAQTYEVLQRYPEAFNWYETYLTTPGLDESTLRTARTAQAAVARRVAIVAIETSPAEADLFVDRFELGSVGRSPRRIAVPAGRHFVRARRAGYRDASSAELDLRAGTASEVSLTLERIEGTLVVDSTPPGAHVTREDDGSELGVTPYRATLPVGPLRVVVAADGFASRTENVVIVEGQEAHLSVELEADASRVAVLTVEGTPREAQVLVDGVELGTAPLTANDMTPGEVDLEIRAPHRDSFRSRVLLEPGAATRIRYVLVDPDAGPSPHLRWVGYGAGAALFVAGAGIGVHARNERDDFFAAPTSSGFDRVERLNHTADALMITGVVAAVTTLVVDLIVDRDHTRGNVEVGR